MRSVIYSICFAAIIISYVLFLIQSSLYSQLLDQDLLLQIFDKPQIHQHIQKAFRLAITNALTSDLQKRGVNFETLTVRQRVELNDNIAEITQVITTDKIAKVVHNNIVNVTSYTNGQTTELIFYLPFTEWGFPDNITSSKSVSMLTSETKIDTLIDNFEGFPISKAQAQKLYNYRQTAKRNWQITATLLFALTAIYLILGKTRVVSNSVGKILLINGGIGISISMIVDAMSKKLILGLPHWKDPLRIFIGTIIPPIALEASRLWLNISLSILISGAAIIFLNYLYSKRKENIQRLKAKNVQRQSSQSLAP